MRNNYPHSPQSTLLRHSSGLFVFIHLHCFFSFFFSDYNILLATFTDNTVKIYDVKPLFTTIDAFKSLQHTPGLFEQVKVDVGGYGISWNDYLDLSCDDIREKGIIQDKEKIFKYA